jgi:hypothetical protein
MLHNIYAVTWLLKDGIMEPKETVVDRQQLDEHVSEATGTSATMEQFF